MAEAEPAYCIGCGARNGVLDDVCRACGGPKKWVYPGDMSAQEIEEGQKRLHKVGLIPARQRQRVGGQ